MAAVEANLAVACPVWRGVRQVVEVLLLPMIGGRAPLRCVGHDIAIELAHGSTPHYSRHSLWLLGHEDARPIAQGLSLPRSGSAGRARGEDQHGREAKTVQIRKLNK